MNLEEIVTDKEFDVTEQDPANQIDTDDNNDSWAQFHAKHVRRTCSANMLGEHFHRAFSCIFPRVGKNDR